MYGTVPGKITLLILFQSRTSKRKVTLALKCCSMANYKFSMWDSVQLNHPYGTSSKFPEQAKEK